MSARVRGATAADVPGLAALLAPEVARGTVLPCVVDPADFLLAELDGVPVGCVALRPWRGGVVELGSLVSAAPGRGLGSTLVLAATAWAEDRGFHEVVVLTALSDFFSSLGFAAHETAPHALARAAADPPLAETALAEALTWKAGRCRACARLSSCRQHLLRYSATPAGRRAA